jgi:hypothetical protein
MRSASLRDAMPRCAMILEMRIGSLLFGSVGKLGFRAVGGIGAALV